MMGTSMTILRGLPAALSSALLEWILLLLLFIDAVYCFLVTRFARLCKLPAPCPFCSRLDHVLGNEEPYFYRELICKTHKSEISSLAYCCLHQKLAGAESMCKGCSSSSRAAKEEPNKDSSDVPMMDADVFHSNQGDGAMLHSPNTRICSCCRQHFEQGRIPLFSRKFDPAEAANPPMICMDYSSSCQADESLEPKDIYHQSDHVSHERYSTLQTTSDSEVEVPCFDDGRNSHPHEADGMEKDMQNDAAIDISVLPFPRVVKQSEMVVQKELITGSDDISSAYPIPDDHPDTVINREQIEAKDISSIRGGSQQDPLVIINDTFLKDADVLQIPVASIGVLPHILGDIEACQRTSESTIYPITSQFTILEQHYAVSGDKNTRDNLDEACGPDTESSGGFDEISVLANDTIQPLAKDSNYVASEDTYMKDNFGDIHISQVSVNSQYVGEIEDHLKKAEPIDDMITYELTSQDYSNTIFKAIRAKDFAEEVHVSSFAVRSSGEVSQGQGLDPIEEHPQTSENIDGKRPSLSTQISMNEAYKLAIGIKNSLPSPTLTDVILGKDSSSVNEELRQLLSQLSASRGLEATWVDPGPSPRAYGRGDDLIVQNITRRISIERNVSGFESLDGSIISEVEGESTIDRLRRQIDLDRKSIHLLYKELEEERNAAAIAASQALAMITRLQDEKAAMQMEASHYQRMMEEQAEYDDEALVEANELLAQREQQVEELEAELENYRIQFRDGESTEEQATEVAFGKQNATRTSLEEERAYIADCLSKLEKKLHSYSNNSMSSDALEVILSDKILIVEDDYIQRQENSRGTKEPVLLANEAQSSTVNCKADLITFQEEISKLNKRLKRIEADRDFLEHSVNSLSNGKEGVLFIREIACNLRELRAIATAIDNK